MGVGVVIGVSLWAVSLASIPCWRALAAHHVDGQGRWFEVSRVDARSIATEVVDGQASGDLPDECLVRHPVRQHRPKDAITLAVHCPRPHPTLVRLRRAGDDELLRRDGRRAAGGAPIAFALQTLATPTGVAGVRLVVLVALRAVGSGGLCCGYDQTLLRSAVQLSAWPTY